MDITKKNKLKVQALKYYQKGQYDKAIKEYQLILEEDPKDVKIWLKTADIYIKKSQIAEAIPIFFKVAQFFYEEQFFLKAIAVYKQILVYDPDRIEANIYLAKLFGHIGLNKEAIKNTEIAILHFTKQADTTNLIETLKLYLHFDPADIPNRIKLAELCSSTGMMETAITEFKKAVELLWGHGRTDEYIKVAERLLYHKNDDIDLAKNLVKIYLEKNDPKRALSKLQLCFKANSRDIDTLFQLATVFKMLNQYSKAISVYKELIKIYQDTDDSDQIHKLTDMILELNPDDSYIRHLEKEKAAPDETDQTRSHSKAGQKALASSAGKRPPLKETEIEVISRLLTETDVYIKYGLSEKAIDHVKMVFNLIPDYIPALKKLKSIYFNLRDLESAINILFKLAELYKDSKPEAAIESLNEILSLEAGNQKAYDMITNLRAKLPSEDSEILEVLEEEADKLLPVEESTQLQERAPDEILKEAPARHPFQTKPDRPENSDIPEDTEEVTSQEDIYIEPIELNAAEFTLVPIQEFPVEENTQVILERAVQTNETPIPEMEEVDFYIEKGLLEEGFMFLKELKALYPNHPDVLAKMAEVQNQISSHKAHPEELLTEPAEVGREDSQMIENFKTDSHEQLGAEDIEAHFEIGIAYKNMGLLDDAIKEFEIAMQISWRKVDCFKFIGLVYIDKNQLEEAFKSFNQALAVEGISPEQRLDVFYEIGQLYEMQGDFGNALKYYAWIKEGNPKYPKINYKIDALKKLT